MTSGILTATLPPTAGPSRTSIPAHGHGRPCRVRRTGRQQRLRLNCGDLYVYLEQAVAEGKLSEEKIDESLTRLYVTRMRLGMFDAEDQVPYNKVGYDVVDSAEMKALNLKVADSIMTLLKNDGTLPLDKSKLHTVGVIGPNADNRKALLGNYEGTASRYTTVLEGIEDYLGDDVKVRYSQGCHLYATTSTAWPSPTS